VVLSTTISEEFGGIEIAEAIGYAVPDAKVALFEIATVQLTGDADVFDTTMLPILFTVAVGGVRPVSVVAPPDAPSAVQLVVTVVPEETKYAVLPLITVTLTMLGFCDGVAMFTP
jgi:hypothetical protein